MKPFFKIFTLLSFISMAHSSSYDIDTTHSSIEFSVSHMVISKTKGNFQKFKGSFETDSKGKVQQFTAEIHVDSIDTKLTKRDDHLKSADFFDAPQFPLMKFESIKTHTRGKKIHVIGILTIKGISKRIALTGSETVTIKDPWGNFRKGLRLRGRIKRKDFGLTYHQVLEAGGLVVGNEVDILLELEGIQKKI
ncbi:YceI family protein [bacterium]|nr:YceI family protein [bacterium]